MTYQEAITATERLGERFDEKFSQSDKDLIVELYYEVLNKTFRPTSCQQCYHDALIEIYLYLKREKKMAKKCNYRMKAGFIISCPDFHNGRIYTNDNLTDAVAREYLQKYPKRGNCFSKMPDPEMEYEEAAATSAATMATATSKRSK